MNTTHLIQGTITSFEQRPSRAGGTFYILTIRADKYRDKGYENEIPFVVGKYAVDQIKPTARRGLRIVASFTMGSREKDGNLYLSATIESAMIYQKHDGANSKPASSEPSEGEAATPQSTPATQDDDHPPF